MTWERLATYALGGVFVLVGLLVPVAKEYLVTAGVGLFGLATRGPGMELKKSKK